MEYPGQIHVNLIFPYFKILAYFFHFCRAAISPPRAGQSGW